ncbi:hypothetical protein [Sphingomonas oligoaromativorans]|jgi:hypothetical protein|uniref:hypothetical protein n=1 Tax=Sphingomonas oligoaromativorans TaxID=575322 RepID=UPI0014206C10|nr:hypothetical protein [Sphingomonas oligoaromativorans]NIJ33007.1 hypothetical protein [Sphingomonas oligoaromativorans]
MHRRRPSDRRRALRRDILGTLALCGMIFVSILALPFGRVHEHACRVVAQVAGREVPCGLTALSVSIDMGHSPYFSIAILPRKLPISL